MYKKAIHPIQNKAIINQFSTKNVIMQNISISIKNYKCFEDTTGFESIKRVNIIIGRNNSGKSSLLDVIEHICQNNYTFDVATIRNNTLPEIIFQTKIPEDSIRQTFPQNTTGGGIGGNHFIYGQQFISRDIRWKKVNKSISMIECDESDILPKLSSLSNYSEGLVKNLIIELENKHFRRIAAERDVVPESGSNEDINIHSNGRGLTNAIQAFINRSSLPSDLVEKKLLAALNEIFAHDAIFTDIVCQLHVNSNLWEIYLEEEHKGRIALSKSGSGLKTVMTVLVNLFLIPAIENKALSEYVFGFEELENNIHPALLRRLNSYLYKASTEHDFTYFLTTHSNVLIDQFSKQKDAQIIHVTQSNGIAICKTAKTYIQNSGILDDLDVRASDLLQANGIIWVEGPSDRIYLNKWIELWSNGALREGTHYQCLFYGGRLLSHLSAGEPQLVDESISIFNTNRNAIILIDSDKHANSTRINETKKRIVREFTNMNAISWITKGKEIENYIPKEVVDIFWSLSGSLQVGQYISFFDYIDSLKPGQGSKYANLKPMLAEKLIRNMTKQNLSPVLDLDSKMTEICQRIREWNS